MSNTFEEIKNQTRLALTDDNEYLFRLDVALYGFASVSSFMTEIICHIDATQDRTKLQDKTSGPILEAFRQTLEKIKKKNLYPSIYDVMQNIADLFKTLNSERTDFVHAYPITSKGGKQILHRRQDSKGKYFEITNAFLGGFISRLHNVSIELYEICSVVRSDL